jgi:hypothetical protein
MENSTSTLTLTGEGQVRARPDIATIHLGVQTQAKTAAQAIRDNATQMNQVVARIKALGVKAEDMQTSGLSLSPVYDYKEGSPSYGQIIAYQVTDTVNVTAAVEQVGQILDEGVAAGANLGGGISFGLRDESAVRRQALQAALRAAQADAAVVAQAMNLNLRGPSSIEILSGGGPIVVRAAMGREMSTPIQPGTLTISATVRMVFDYIRPTRQA